MIDYNLVTGRSQDTINRIYQAAEKRDLAELAREEATTQPAPLVRIGQVSHSIRLRLSSVKQVWVARDAANTLAVIKRAR